MDPNFQALGRAPTVLIVDDLNSARRIVAKLLAKLGVTNVVEAKNGSEALEIVAQQEIDVVISDWDMPNMNGMELLRKLRTIPQFSKLPFIMITSTPGREDVVDAVNAGVSDYLTKPFDADLLKEKIEAVLVHTPDV